MERKEKEGEGKKIPLLKKRKRNEGKENGKGWVKNRKNGEKISKEKTKWEKSPIIQGRRE